MALKNPSPKQIIQNEIRKIRKIRAIFDIENCWNSYIGTFWRSVWNSVNIKIEKYFFRTDFWGKICPMFCLLWSQTPPLTDITLNPSYLFLCKMAGALSNLKEELECLICTEIPDSGPIKQCKNGHFACKNCLPKLKFCPLCQEPIDCR